MKTVKVKRAALLERMTKNRDVHSKTFTDAMVGFRAACIAEAEENLRKMRTPGGPINVFLQADRPSDHTDDYNRVIQMVEMSVDETLELDDREFRMYVMDEWQWKVNFDNTVSKYNNRG